MREDDLQRSVAELLDMLGWFWWHTPNGGKRNPREAARFVGLGVKPGVSDIIVSEPWVCPMVEIEHGVIGGQCPTCGGAGRGSMVAIELKVGNNKPTELQRSWMDKARQRGWLVAVCRSLAEVQVFLRVVRPINGRRMP